MPVSALRSFLKLESAGGILLVIASAVALLISNSPLAGAYGSLLATPVVVAVGDLAINKPLLLWINDGLMALFFFLIGLEVKREVLEGQLSSRDQLVLPAVAAVGGFVVPAFIYLIFNHDDPGTVNGWAIPAATDIAFALGVLAILGSRVPLALKVFLTTVAIFDDIGAIVVIALFYTSNLSVTALVLGGAGVFGLLVLNRLGVRKVAAYALVGLFVWVCVLKSGVHATLAGFVVALAIPIEQQEEDGSPLRRLEHALHPWVAYAILPVFAFANAGVSFAGVSSDVWLGPVTLGISLGLLIGKQLGVFGAIVLCVVTGIARKPAGATWTQLYGIALLTGIGFTMSLFIGSLAFDPAAEGNLVATRLGVIAGSVVSAVAGFTLLRLSLPERESAATR